ncbi:MAG: hypothetical protein IGS39_12165 [Calothrix sp. C42_A2020_038]|nr:hypothetical protein [Calothrix sp. C42_A2020_038]
MGGLYIADLSFCETANDEQVIGGLSVRNLSRSLSSLRRVSTLGEVSVIAEPVLAQPVLEKISSQEKGEFLVEEFKDESGENYAYKAVSKDGRKQISGSVGSIGNLNYAVSRSEVTI